MAETSGNPYGTQCGVGCLWNHMDGLLRVDVVLLGLLLVFTLVLVIRASRSCRLARHEGIQSPAGKTSFAALKAHIGHLRTIASIAPYLGLLGTCLGILSTFSGSIVMEARVYLAWLAATMAAVLVPCAAGIVVAVSATCGHTYGQKQLELLASRLPSHRRLTRRPFTEFSLFGLIAAWLLALLIRVYFLPFTPLPTHKGFEVAIASVPCDTSERRFIVLRLSARGGIFLNSEEEQNWKTLQSRLSEIYRLRSHRVLYLSADEGVSFQAVADAIDTVRNTPEDITVLLVPPTALNAGCPEARVVGGSTRHPTK